MPVAWGSSVKSNVVVSANVAPPEPPPFGRPKRKVGLVKPPVRFQVFSGRTASRSGLLVYKGEPPRSPCSPLTRFMSAVAASPLRDAASILDLKRVIPPTPQSWHCTSGAGSCQPLSRARRLVPASRTETTLSAAV